MHPLMENEMRVRVEDEGWEFVDGYWVSPDKSLRYSRLEHAWAMRSQFCRHSERPEACWPCKVEKDSK